MQGIHWLPAFLAGAALGSFFFGSLWWTVRQLPTTGWPIRLIIGSYVGRMAIALLGFYLIIHGDWRRAIAGMIGFIAVRFLFVQRLHPSAQRLSSRVE